MPNGERRGERGFTYLGVLLLVALAGALVAGVGERATLAAARERERELLFRGAQIRAAIERYVAASPEGALPPSLDALLEDRRGPRPRHHLRRRYTDPFTGRADWLAIEVEQGGERRLVGVRSRADAPRVLHVLRGGEIEDGPRVSDLRFVAAVPVAASAAGAAGSAPTFGAEGFDPLNRQLGAPAMPAEPP